MISKYPKIFRINPMDIRVRSVDTPALAHWQQAIHRFTVQKLQRCLVQLFPEFSASHSIDNLSPLHKKTNFKAESRDFSDFRDLSCLRASSLSLLFPHSFSSNKFCALLFCGFLCPMEFISSWHSFRSLRKRKKKRKFICILYYC